jgi:hypothetical protein
VVKRIVLFLLIVTGAWWLYNGGAASIGNRLEDFGGGLQPAVRMDADPEDVLCLQGARDAYSQISSDLSRLPPPPLDEEVWRSILLDANWQVRQAQSVCGCPSHACSKARQALEELNGAVRTVEGMVSGTRAGNPASALERADELLSDARRLASGG